MFQANHARRLYAKRAPKPRDLIDLELKRFLENEFLPELNPPPDRLCHEIVELKGPISSVDTRISTLIEEGIYRDTSIDPASVNSVILNNDPQEHTDKYLVAASVLQKEATNSLMARYTTLMPSIRGFGQLMALIFCPTMEIKRDKDNTRYKSFIAGLGYDHANKCSYYSAHNMRIDLDVQITADDFIKVRKFFLQQLISFAHIYTSLHLRLTRFVIVWIRCYSPIVDNYWLTHFRKELKMDWP